MPKCPGDNEMLFLFQIVVNKQFADFVRCLTFKMLPFHQQDSRH